MDPISWHFCNVLASFVEVFEVGNEVPNDGLSSLTLPIEVPLICQSFEDSLLEVVVQITSTAIVTYGCKPSSGLQVPAECSPVGCPTSL